MNDEVMKGLLVTDGKCSRIADLGCGVGTVARHIAIKIGNVKITAITISDYQIQKGKELIREDGLTDAVSMVRNNFESLDFADETFTHAYALESACHAHGSGKDLFVSEMARVLQPGGRFCIADGFIKNNQPKPGLFNFLYKKIIRYWALPCFGNINDFAKQLEKNDLQDIRVREISMRIAPSVAYVPWTCLKFFIREIWKNKSLRMKKERWHNVYGPVLGMILGLYRKHFGYFIISGRKANK